MIDNTEVTNDLLILGEPIKTVYGTFHFYTYLEYTKRLEELSLISFSTLKFYYMIRENMIKNRAKKKELVDLMKMKEIPLFEYVKMNPFVLGAYAKVWGEVIEHDVIDYGNPDVIAMLEEEDFLAIREIVMKMNLLKEEVLSPSPKIQDRIERSKRAKAGREGDTPNLETILTSIFIETGVPYSELIKMTAYQLIATFRRIHSIRNFEVSALMSTVSSEVKWQRWDENHTVEIESRDNEEHVITGNSLEQITGKFF